MALILLRVVENPLSAGGMPFGVAVQPAPGAPWMQIRAADGPMGWPTRAEAQHEIPNLRAVVEEHRFHSTGACGVCGCTELNGCVLEDVDSICWWLATPGLCSGCGSDVPLPRQPLIEE